jgi:hypothetical protein
MKFTVDIDKAFTHENVNDWHNSHYAVIQRLAEQGIFYVVNQSAHGRIHADFEIGHGDFSDREMLLMRLALGDDIRRLRTDSTRFFLGIEIDQWLPGLKEVEQRGKIQRR